MSIIKDTLEYRDRMLRQLKNKYRNNKPAAVLEAEEVIAKYNEEKANANPQIARLETEECPPSICRECFYMRDLSFHLKPIQGDSDYDYFECPECKRTYKEMS